MTLAIGVILVLAGFVASVMHPVNRMGPILVFAGALVVVLRAFGAVAADLPVPPPGVTPAQMRSAIADQERRKRMTRKQFENILLRPIGKGRL